MTLFITYLMAEQGACYWCQILTVLGGGLGYNHQSKHRVGKTFFVLFLPFYQPLSAWLNAGFFGVFVGEIREIMGLYSS
jgi:uncharacterized membrane protein (UPF0182 family)